MSVYSWPPRYPVEVLDYTFDWSKHIGDDSVVALKPVEVDQASGLVIESYSLNGNVQTVRISGGNPGKIGHIQLGCDTANSQEPTVVIDMIILRGVS
ncbi:hypothetical protein K3172_12820 [Qipengyuania sp. 6B39]|uniref:phage fiber-tail adaptor protein n=1 Tax=Qipengyuania proteolytica TaxID=2867239 RepID=UPI001C8A2497|nr:hypothetical protein [Qipengyuania proteolytica]MBX7496741.1 hypothetical protein [Qipengyuania proteolytica]